MLSQIPKSDSFFIPTVFIIQFCSDFASKMKTEVLQYYEKLYYTWQCECFKICFLG